MVNAAEGRTGRNAERFTTAGVVLGVLAVGAIAWWFQLRPPLRVDATPLRTLPAMLDGWRSREIPLEVSVESMLRADLNVHRVYVHRGGNAVWLYIGYYGTERGGQPEHTPRYCYQAHGWEIEAERIVDVDPSRHLRANEYIVAREGERRLVHFWYRSYRGSGILGTSGLALVGVLGRLTDGRADGALVRISTAIGSADELAARAQLLSFANAIETQLADHWPREAPAS